MLAPPEIVQTAARLTAVIHFTIPRAEVHNAMGPGIGELMAAVAAQGVAPAGPIFSHHMRSAPDTFDFEVGVPVTAPIAAAGRVTPSQLPAATVVRTIYCGPYEGLGPAWVEFNAWIDAQGHTPRSDLWEYYVTGPASSPDPSTWRTELNRPVIR